jgi:transcriptional activator of cad operon
MGEQADAISVGLWVAKRGSGELLSNGHVERLEPKTMDLLFLLASQPGEAFSKDAIMETVWPGVVVGDDTIARTVSRLRKALGDDAKTPRYIETLHKRGYRLIAEVSAAETTSTIAIERIAAPKPAWRWSTIAGVACVLAIVTVAALRFADVPSAAAGPRALTERATDFYFQYTRADNEAALALFQQILADYPDYAPALAGIANALVQKVVRWPDTPGAVSYGKLGDALRGGATKTPEAQRLLARAELQAVRATELAPNDPSVLKALGLVRSAEGQFDAAIGAYQKAVAADHDAWGSLINIGDVLEISGRPQLALPYFEAAYAAMTRVYDQQSARVRPWQAELGVLIGDRYRDRGDAVRAGTWYRRVLATAPLNVEATTHLAATLRRTGNTIGADALCSNLALHLQTAGCGS